MQWTQRTIVRVLVLGTALSLVAGACGDDGDDGAGPSGTTREGAAEAAQPSAVPGFDGETIRLGVITALTTPAAMVASPMAEGARVYFDHVNDELGGIAGTYRVELVVEDNQYSAPVAVEAYERIRDDVVMIGQVFNVHMAEALLPHLQEDRVVAAIADIDSAFLREQYLLPVFAPYEIQAINAMSYWQEHGGQGESACVAYREDPHFAVAVGAVEFAADEMGFDVAKVVSFPEGNQDWSAQIDELSGCEMVYLAASAVETPGILGAAAQAQLTPQWIGQGSTWVAPIWNALVAPTPVADYMQANLWVVSQGPEWGDTSVDGMASMLEHIRRYAPDQQPDPLFIVGYVDAWAVHQVLEKAVEMGDLSREGIVEAMNSIDTLDFDGLAGSHKYGPPQERDPARGSTIFRIVPDQPGVLSAVSEVGFVSDAAESYDFAPER